MHLLRTVVLLAVSALFVLPAWADESPDRFEHGKKFHVHVGAAVSAGGLDSYYSRRDVVEDGEVLDTWAWQSIGFTEPRGGLVAGVGIGATSWLWAGVDFTFVGCQKWLLEEYRTADSSENTIGSTTIPAIERTWSVLIEPKIRLWIVPTSPVKPYGGLGLGFLIVEGFELDSEWAPDRPAALIFGPSPTFGVQIDLSAVLGLFIETPFMFYVDPGHANEEEEGAADLLLDDEHNMPYQATLHMWRLQMGLQLRI